MLPIALLALGGGAIGAAVAVVKRRQQASLVSALATQKRSSLPQQLQARLALVKTEVTASIVAVDEKYQRFMQTRIDPLLGKARHSQMQELLSAEALALTRDERFANRRIALGGLALGAALLGQFVFPPLTGVAILLGLSTIWGLYYWAYLEWQRTRRIGMLHLTCIYVAFLWLGGYASIGALGSFLLGIALKVKAITENQSRSNLIHIFQLQPDKVWVRSNGIEVEIPFAELKVGDTLVLHAGQVTPVDGVITAGVATVDQHMLTGEAQPVEKTVGDPVLASTVMLSGKVDVQVEKTGADTTAGQIGAILNQTAQHNSALALKILEMTDRFAVPTLALSVVSWPFIGSAGAVSLLGANTTITSHMSGPLAVLNFLNLAAKGGILIKDGGALERLNDVDTIVFDKTGTLTLEQPQVALVHALNGLSEAEVLTLAAAAEARQTHPIARAILAAATAQGLALPAIDGAHYEVGYGLKVQLRKSSVLSPQSPVSSLQFDPTTPDSELRILVRVGSARFMTMEGIALPPPVNGITEACQALGHSLVMVALDDELVGCIELQPTVRPEAKRIIEGLHERNLALYIISGDQEAPTRKLAEELGMTGYFANTLPDQKATLVEKLQAEGRQVCFIGDGINDALAMRKAQVSISLRGATSVATDTAQIVLMEGNLNQLLHLFEIAVEFEGNLKRNFRFTAGVSLAAAAGILLAGFTFAATEVFFVVSLLGGLAIAMKPMLDAQKKEQA